MVFMILYFIIIIQLFLFLDISYIQVISFEIISLRLFTWLFFAITNNLFIILEKLGRIAAKERSSINFIYSFDVQNYSVYLSKENENPSPLFS